MSGLNNTRKRLFNLGHRGEYKTGTEMRQEKAAKAQAKLDEIYTQSAAVPDDEAIKRNERRKSAKRKGSRASTVLTEETLG